MSWVLDLAIEVQDADRPAEHVQGVRVPSARMRLPEVSCDTYELAADVVCEMVRQLDDETALAYHHALAGASGDLRAGRRSKRKRTAAAKLAYREMRRALRRHQARRASAAESQ